MVRTIKRNRWRSVSRTTKGNYMKRKPSHNRKARLSHPLINTEIKSNHSDKRQDIIYRSGGCEWIITFFHSTQSVGKPRETCVHVRMAWWVDRLCVWPNMRWSRCNASLETQGLIGDGGEDKRRWRGRREKGSFLLLITKSQRKRNSD